MHNLTTMELAGMIDHAVLKPNATVDDLKAGCELAAKHQVASMCVRPCDIPLACELLEGSKVAVGTVIGFPHGCHLTQTKVAEAAHAIDCGAAELDMVLNISRLCSGDIDAVRDDIAAVVQTAREVPVKVIFECCYLNEQQILEACQACIDANAAMVKTSTGFGSFGAKVEHVRLMRENTPATMGVKASGGISCLADALAMIEAGATRLGTSRTAQILAEFNRER